MSEATLLISSKNYSSWSLRGFLLAKLSGINFTEEHVSPDDPRAREELLMRTSSILVPCLIHGDVSVWDTLAIAEYLNEVFPEANMLPKEKQARARCRSIAGEMHSGFSALRERCTMNCGVRIQLHDMPQALLDDVARIDELWREGLARFGGPFLAGARFHAVDAMYAPIALRVQTYGLAFFGEAAAYAQRLRALPAMQEWYAAALRETWREPGHEAEAKATGTWLEDLRAG